MDCFYAAIEMRDKPELRNKPIAVCGQSARSVLSTCNYEARKFGCRSAMPTYQAVKLCPNLILLPPRFDVYKEESRRIRSIFEKHTNAIEPISLDEAFLDVSHSDRYAWDIAKEIRQQIFDSIELTASAGISCNKLLAKIASDLKKPNGQAAILPEDAISFMAKLPVRTIWGIGPKMETSLNQLGLKTCGDLQKFSKIELIERFGRFGSELFYLCRGIDDRPVETNFVAKSLSTERTFEHDLHHIEKMLEEVDLCWKDLQKDLAKPRYLQRKIHKAFVKLKFSDFSRTTKECICKVPAIDTFYKLLVQARERKPLSVRLIGIGVRFEDENGNADMQLTFPGF